MNSIKEIVLEGQLRGAPILDRIIDQVERARVTTQEEFDEWADVMEYLLAKWYKRQ